jgi:tetratricopeptide (TPR) repeat protein
VFIALFLGVFQVFSVQKKILAQSQLANPLKTKIDPSELVIPSAYGQRELSSFEKYRIEKTIAELNQTAKAQLKQGNQDRAFELWYRQLKLTRAINAATEIQALGEVGAIAWQENRGPDVRNIAERLIQLEAEITAKTPLSLDLLNRFATAYQQVRYLDRGINVQIKITKISRRIDNYNLTVEQENLEVLGELYLAKFDYQNAVKIYQTLLSFTDTEQAKLQPKNKAGLYLKTLVDIYDRTVQIDQAIATKQRLIEHYALSKQPEKIAELEIAIAQDYETLNQKERAVEAYNRAFAIASRIQRLATANDALTKLAELYQNGGRVNEAIAAYTKLLDIQQQSYDYYSLIDTYDALGKIYLKLEQPEQAKYYFQQGLKLAQTLNYKVAYFNQQLGRF